MEENEAFCATLKAALDDQCVSPYRVIRRTNEADENLFCTA